MKLRISIAALLLMMLAATPAFARNYIIRISPTASAADVCSRHAMAVMGEIDDKPGSPYIAVASDILTPNQVIAELSGDPDVVDVEEDKPLSLPETAPGLWLNQSTTALLDSLGTASVVSHFGQPVLNLYASQKATELIRLNAAQSVFAAYGTGITVAVIDTGVDPNHPALQTSVIPGYDFVRNLAGTASEWADVSQSTTALLDQSTTALLDGNFPVALNQSTTALLDQSTTALLDTNQLPKAFGHGTMVAGIVHLTAPNAKIMPLKAFTADGNASLSDILRAIYYAADHGADVINMSFSLLAPSVELVKAVGYAADMGVTCVASTGNTGLGSVGYPAAAPKVIAVASTTNSDARSLFSSYGTPTWVGAPGEGVVTTYPGGHYAAASGTSFSAPFVAGGVALVLQVNPLEHQYSKTSKAISQASKTTSELGYGRLDLVQALLYASKD